MTLSPPGFLSCLDIILKVTHSPTRPVSAAGLGGLGNVQDVVQISDDDSDVEVLGVNPAVGELCQAYASFKHHTSHHLAFGVH